MKYQDPVDYVNEHGTCQFTHVEADLLVECDPGEIHWFVYKFNVRRDSALWGWGPIGKCSNIHGLFAANAQRVTRRVAKIFVYVDAWESTTLFTCKVTNIYLRQRWGPDIPPDIP